MVRRRTRLRDKDFEPCPECTEYLLNNPLLVPACASVGIERGMTTETALNHYLASFHSGGHQELP